MGPRKRSRTHHRPLIAELVERLVGRGETVIAARDPFPVIVASYPRGRAIFAAALETALRFTYHSLPQELRRSYDDVLALTPSVIVADLRSRNLCSCLGHHHPDCAHGQTARRLARDVGSDVGEIDLAVDAIRGWEPRPLSGLAASGQSGGESEYLDARFQSALLSVFLHELEHVAFPSRSESEVRRRSDAFYHAAVSALTAERLGVAYGI